MKHRFLILFAVLGMVAPANMTYAVDEVYGTMMVVKGDVKVTQAKGGKTENARVGFKVYSGDTIVAAADSRAKIVMSDKNVINISPDSKLTIEKYQNDASGKNVDLKVDYGKVRASVEQKYDGDKNKFNVKTPTAVAGVRGTDFMAGFNPSTRASTVTTFSGMVAVGQPGPGGQIVNAVFVRPGQTTNVATGQKPEPPKAMPREELNKQNNESSADTAPDTKSDATPAGGNTQAEKKEETKEEKKEQVAEKKEQAPEKKEQPGDKAEAKQEPKQEQAKKESAKEKSDSRAPASLSGGGSMIDAKDLDVKQQTERIDVRNTGGGPSSGPTSPQVMPTPAPTPFAPPPPPVPTPPQKSSVIIRVQ